MRNRAWSSTIRIRTRSKDCVAVAGPPRRRSEPWYSVIRSPSASTGSRAAQPYRLRPRANLELRADQLGPLAHELPIPKLRRPLAATASVSKPRPSSRTSITHCPSSSAVVTTTFVAPACLRTFCSASCTTRSTTVWCASSRSVVAQRARWRCGGPRATPAWRPCRRWRRRAPVRRARAAGAARGSSARHPAPGGAAPAEIPAPCAPGGDRTRRRGRLNSTWKMALDSACAGPSWTSCASRARSASWASTIRIWSSVGPDGSEGSVTASSRPAPGTATWTRGCG